MGKVAFVAICLFSLSNAAVAQDADRPAYGIQHPASSTPYKRAERERTDSPYRAAQAAFAGSVAFDLATTMRLPSGWAEGNPVLGRSRAQQIGMSLGLGLLTLWQAHRLEIEGHTKAAKFCLWLGASLHSSAASYNMTRAARSVP